MLTSNYIKPVGLTNGSTGTVYDIIQRVGAKVGDLPYSILIKFND